MQITPAFVDVEADQGLGGYARVTVTANRTLVAIARVQEVPSRTLGARAHVSTDQGTRFLGGLAAVRGDHVVTLGGLAHVVGDQFMRLNAVARVAILPVPTLGGLAHVAGGPVFGAVGRIEAIQTKVLGMSAHVVEPGSVPTPGFPGYNPYSEFWPNTGRRYAEQETNYLELVYANYPLPSGSANLAWLADNVYLPVNPAKLTFQEPVKELRLDSLQGRHLVVVEQEADSPRVTRARTFQLDFPTLSIHLLRFFASRLRLGTQFTLRLRLFDVEGECWEPLYTDPSDPESFGLVYWGTLPSWQSGSVVIRRDGVLLDLENDLTELNTRLGRVTFPASQGSAVIQAQYIYEPMVQVVSIEPEPRAGTKFNRFAPQVTLLELPPPLQAAVLRVIFGGLARVQVISCLCSSLLSWWSFNEATDPRVDLGPAGQDAVAPTGSDIPESAPGLLDDCVEIFGTHAIPGLVSWWSFDEATDPRTDSTNDHDATQVQGAGPQATGLVDSSISLGHFAIGTSPFFNYDLWESTGSESVWGPDDSFYCGGWVRFDLQGNDDRNLVMLQTDNTDGHWVIGYRSISGLAEDGLTHLGFYFGLQCITGFIPMYAVETGAAVPDDEWHFIFCWYDAANLTISIQLDDNVPVTVTLTDAATGDSGTILFGNGSVNPTLPSTPTDIRLDEWFFGKNVVLTAPDRAWLYNDGAGQSFNVSGAIALHADPDALTDTYSPDASFYLAGWFKFSFHNSFSSTALVIGQGLVSPVNYELTYYEPDVIELGQAVLKFTMRLSDTTIVNVIVPVDAPVDEWHWAVAWYDQDLGTLNVQFDQEVPQSVSIAAPPMTENLVFRFVQGLPGNGRFYLDEWIFGKGCVITEGDRIWLYNEGAGRAHSELAGYCGFSCLCENLVSWWSLDEATDPRVDSHGPYDLAVDIIFQDTTTQELGLVGNAIGFGNSDAEVNFPGEDDGTFYPNASFYAAGWFYYETLPTAEEGYVNNMQANSLVFFEGDAAMLWGIYHHAFALGGENIVDVPEGLSFGINTTNTAPGVNTWGGEVVDAGFTPVAGEWHWVCGWYDASVGPFGTLNIQVDDNPPVAAAMTELPIVASLGPGTGQNFSLNRRLVFSGDEALRWREDEWVFGKGCVPTEADRVWLYNGGAGHAYSALAAYCNPVVVPTAELLLWAKAGEGIWKNASRTIPAIADGDTITVWDDLHGEPAHVLLQPTEGIRPVFKPNQINGFPAVQFHQKTLKALFGSHDTDAYVVMRRTSSAMGTAGGMFGGSNWAVSDDFFYPAPSIELWNGQAALRNNSGIPMNTWVVVNVRVSGNSLVGGVYLNEDPAFVNSSFAPRNPTYFQLGEAISPLHHLDVAEVLVYDNLLSDPDRNTVLAYLGTKFNLY